MAHPDLDLDLLRRTYKEKEMSMDDCHIIGLQRKLRHTHIF